MQMVGHLTKLRLTAGDSKRNLLSCNPFRFDRLRDDPIS